MQTPTVLSAQENLVLMLRKLYEGYGYSRFPMRRFEEYALYSENKNFLTSESVLSFTNANGKLMALRPDVTLSIVKHARAERCGVEKLYYNESVYRLSPTDHEFMEIEQIGVEYLGEIDLYGTCEVLRLAIESLKLIGVSYVMDISHVGFAGGLMADAGLTSEQCAHAFSLIQQKNVHELKNQLTKWQIAPLYAERIILLPTLAGNVETTLAKAADIAIGIEMKQAVSELSKIYSVMKSLGMADHVRLDFSILNDLAYYNGLVFQGYAMGAPRMVLSGGRYDRLMRKFGKAGDGLGFALYLDELTRILSEQKDFDVDVLALYTEQDDAGKVLREVEKLQSQGIRVLAATRKTNGLRAKTIMRFVEDAFKEVDPSC